jgi:hypothetical protein
VITLATRLKTARQVLNWLDDWFVAQHKKNTDEGPKLWNVLAALRGPDAENSYTLKDVTTARIRTAAFPRLAKTAHRLGASFSEGGKVVSVPAVPEGAVKHFVGHAKKAAKALGLRIRKMKKE